MLQHDEQQVAVDKILKSFDGNMAKVLAKMEKLLNRYLSTSEITALSSLVFDVEFDVMLNEAGYYTVVNDFIDNDYDKLFPLITKGFAEGGFDVLYTKDSLNKIMAIKALQENSFTVVGSTAGTTLRENLFNYALSNYTSEDMQKQMLEDFAGTNLVKYTKTLANTSIKEFQESTIDIAAEGLDGVWVYTGVRDSLNRDFCRCVLDKHYYYNEADKNKLRFSEERRYNCRHRFRMVTEDYAKKDRYKKSTGSLC